MLTFKQYITLLEAKLDDIKRGIANRHKAETGEDIPPDELHDVVTKAKKIPGVDLTKSSYRELKDKVNPGIKQIYHDPKTGVTINHVTRKDACTKEYGHGKTNWCVAATGEGNRFDRYGEGGKNFFTVHHKDPDTGKVSIYGIHEHERGDVRNEKNEKVVPPPDVLKAMAKTKELTGINIISKNPEFKPTSEDITRAMKHPDGGVARAALQFHKDKITPEHIDMAMKHPNGGVARAALQFHKDKITPEHIDMAMKHPNGGVAIDALLHHPDKIKPEHITSEIARDALLHHPDKIKPEHITMAMKHPDSEIARDALLHHPDKIKPEHITMAMKHPDSEIARDALQLHKDKITPEHITMAMKHPESIVAKDALEYHKDKIKPEHITMAMKHPDSRVARDALQLHKDKITPEHIEMGKNHHDGGVSSRFANLD